MTENFLSEKQRSTQTKFMVHSKFSRSLRVKIEARDTVKNGQQERTMSSSCEYDLFVIGNATGRRAFGASLFKGNATVK